MVSVNSAPAVVRIACQPIVGNPVAQAALALGATITCSDKPARIWAKIIMWDVKILEVLLALKA
ncbi:MAG: hypothetical protein EBW28_06725 [Actinobacteria bacterium]|nr:hypothetical protein [Actinomycetota bacterium]